MDAFDILQLFIPIITFAMGYFLTNIGYRRDRKLAIAREKFEKLYHPFILMIHDLGNDTAEGFELSSEDSLVFKQLFNHLSANGYLATSKGQRLIWETRALWHQCLEAGDKVSEDTEEQLGQSITELFQYLMHEYAKSANALGYDLLEMGAAAKQG